METSIRFGLNGRSSTLHVDDERTLLWVLRTDLGLTGTKYGCGTGLCGACTVMIGGEAVRSCLTPLKEVKNRDVLTVEGLARDGGLHPLQRAFIEHGGAQCGYCTPGMLMTAYALLQKDRRPSRAAIVAGMEHNLCRCGSHQRIIAAIEAAARHMGEGS